ncbi:MAG: hypothetical protein U5N26_01085 [Candidatus Marinimicrobia bacterium]|nr:hypothetical protein [Candidatus Neomarinimicrobiota bacterium]
MKEAETADLLLKVIDVSDANFREHIRTIDTVLKDFDIPEKRFITIFNKTDLLSSDENIRHIKQHFPGAICISATRGIGIDRVVRAIRERIEDSSYVHDLYVDPENGKLVADLHRFGEVLDSRFVENKILFRVFLDKPVYHELKKKYRI